jgi:hypothetical protein
MGRRYRSPGPTPAVRPCQRWESATDMRLDGDEMTADADDGNAGHSSGTYILAVGSEAPLLSVGQLRLDLWTAGARLG